MFRYRYLNLVFLFLLSCSVEDLDRQGVQIYNNIGETTLSQINKAGILDEGELPCAYYDTSLTLNGEDVYLVTDKRVVHYVKGRSSAMNLSEVKSVEKQSDNIVVSDGKTKLYLNILVDLDLFMSVLEDNISKSASPEPQNEVQPKAPVPVSTPQPQEQQVADEVPPPSETEPSAEQPPQNNTNSDGPSRRRGRPRKR
jgi:hypothetical protein